MTQVSLGVEIPAAQNLTSLRRHVNDDVTRATFGRRDTAFESIEKRFRADLSRRLRRLRAQLEGRRGSGAGDPAAPTEMPTIAAKPSAGAWRMPRPPRRRRASYQSVTHAVLHPLAMLSPRTSSSSVPPSCRRALADSSASLSDDPLTSPEVARSRDSMTSSVSDLSGTYGASARAASESDLSPTGVGGVGDVIAIYSKSVERETSNRLWNVEKLVSRPGESPKNVTVSHTESNISVVIRPQNEERTLDVSRRQDDAEEHASDELPEQSSTTLEDVRPTSTIRKPPKSKKRVVRYESEENAENTGFHVLDQRRSAKVGDFLASSATGNLSQSSFANTTRRRPEVTWRKYSADVVSTLSSWAKGTGSSFEERRRTTTEDTTRNSGKRGGTETVADDVFIPQPPVTHGQPGTLTHFCPEF